jgi:hypothetical protein
MHCGSIFRFEFSYTDNVRYNFARIGSFSKFSIFHKVAFVFVSSFTVFTSVFVFKCKSRKRLRSFPTIFILSCDGSGKGGAAVGLCVAREMRRCGESLEGRRRWRRGSGSSPSTPIDPWCPGEGEPGAHSHGDRDVPNYGRTSCHPGEEGREVTKREMGCSRSLQSLLWWWLKLGSLGWAYL